MHLLLLIFLTVLNPSSLPAASDGTLGVTSTGTTNITFTIPQLIVVGNFADVNLNFTGSGDLNSNQNIFVSVNYGSSPATRLYRVTATGTGTSGAFTLSSGANTIAYEAWFNDQTGTSGRNTLTANSALINQSGANAPLTSTTSSANYSIRLSQANLLAAPAGNYNGTLSFVFEPE